MKESRFLLDSSIWLAYFLTKNKEIGRLVESDYTELYTSAISLFEVKRKLRKIVKTTKSISSALELIKDNSQIVIISEEIAEKAADIALETGLHTVDAIIYCSAMEKEAVLVTGDNDFRDLPKTEIMKL